VGGIHLSKAMTSVQTNQQQLETALRELAKLIKAVQYYPPGHPALKAAVGDARSAFEPLLADKQSLICTVRKEGFFLSDQPVGAQNQVLRKLSLFLFSRRVQSLTILPDLSKRDLSAFAQALALDLAEIRRLGGIKKVMENARVRTLWINETDLESILAERERLDNETVEPPSGEEIQPNREDLLGLDGEQQISLKELLKALRRENDVQRYQKLVQELIPRIRQSANPDGRLALLEALALLCRHSSDEQRSEELRNIALQAVVQLADPELIGFLIDFLCDRELNDRHRQLLMKILVFIGDSTIDKLMDRLTREENAHNRKLLLETLARQGARTLPILAEYLHDERWYVVRNAATILGQIRHPEGARYLNPLLHHEDIRVCREAIRALTRIGGPGAAQALLRALEDKDEEIRRQALYSLAVIKDQSTLPALIGIVRQSDLLMKQTGMRKEAINVLGEIGSPEAIPLLTWLVNQKRWFKRSQHNELRIAAIQALGEIKHPDAIPALERASRDKTELVARKAAQILKQLKPTEIDGYRDS